MANEGSAQYFIYIISSWGGAYKYIYVYIRYNVEGATHVVAPAGLRVLGELGREFQLGVAVEAWTAEVAVARGGAGRALGPRLRLLLSAWVLQRARRMVDVLHVDRQGHRGRVRYCRAIY